MIVATTFVYISDLIDPIWEKPKDWFGSKTERDELVKFITNFVECLPVTVIVTRIRKSRNFCFRPIFVNGNERHVMFANHQFRIAVQFADVTARITAFIKDNDLYADGKRHYVQINLKTGQ